MIISLSRWSARSMEYSTWSRRIADLAGAVSRLEAEATPLGVPSPGSTAWHANLFQKLLPQVTGGPYLIVAVAGGTNIGKSAVFNLLVVFNMVQWPEDREHCLRWLDTFCKGTRAPPAHVYAVPRARAAARETRL